MNEQSRPSPSLSLSLSLSLPPFRLLFIVAPPFEVHDDDEVCVWHSQIADAIFEEEEKEESESCSSSVSLNARDLHHYTSAFLHAPRRINAATAAAVVTLTRDGSEGVSVCALMMAGKLRACLLGRLFIIGRLLLLIIFFVPFLFSLWPCAPACRLEALSA